MANRLRQLNQWRKHFDTGALSLNIGRHELIPASGAANPTQETLDNIDYHERLHHAALQLLMWDSINLSRTPSTRNVNEIRCTKWRRKKWRKGVGNTHLYFGGEVTMIDIFIVFSKYTLWKKTPWCRGWLWTETSSRVVYLCYLVYVSTS